MDKRRQSPGLAGIRVLNSRIMAGVARLAAWAGLSVSLLAAPGETWLRVKSPNFELFTTSGGNGSGVEFSCGPQKGQRIRVEYDAAETPGALGVVRTIEFQ